VGGDTVQAPGGDAAVVRVHGTDKALAITTDCTPRYCYADPYEGGKQAIAEAYRNLCAVGALPLAVTNCLNFANPQRPEIMAQIVHALEGMSEACRALDFPIVSGNVSLYNESKATGGGSAILPTPAIGGVGLLEDWRKSASLAFKADGEKIVLIGGGEGGVGQSLWLREVHGREDGPPPPVDLAAERRTGELIRRLIAEGLVTAVHDVSDGGLAVAIAEMALAGGLGAELNETADTGLAGRWFCEAQGRYVVTTNDFRGLADAIGQAVPHRCIGTTGLVNRMTGEQAIAWRLSAPNNRAVELGCDVSLAELRAAHEGFFPKLMGASLTAS
jgi:phosphoribosylformylglycinamidine (FGAM) synthase-like enzyme